MKKIFVVNALHERNQDVMNLIASHPDNCTLVGIADAALNEDTVALKHGNCVPFYGSFDVIALKESRPDIVIGWLPADEVDNYAGLCDSLDVRFVLLSILSPLKEAMSRKHKICGVRFYKKGSVLYACRQYGMEQIRNTVAPPED